MICLVLGFVFKWIRSQKPQTDWITFAGGWFIFIFIPYEYPSLWTFVCTHVNLSCFIFAFQQFILIFPKPTQFIPWKWLMGLSSWRSWRMKVIFTSIVEMKNATQMLYFFFVSKKDINIRFHASIFGTFGQKKFHRNDYYYTLLLCSRWDFILNNCAIKSLTFNIWRLLMNRIFHFPLNFDKIEINFLHVLVESLKAF